MVIDGYKVKDRSTKTDRRPMVVNGRGRMTLTNEVVAKKGREAAARIAAREAKRASRG